MSCADCAVSNFTNVVAVSGTFYTHKTTNSMQLFAVANVVA